MINDTVLKQQLAIIDKELLEANASLGNIPNADVDFEEAIDFAEEYLKNPSKLWSEAKVKTKLKLQWFQFPLGLTFNGEIFGTTEIASVFKTKEAFLPLKSSNVDLKVQFWNQFAKECDYLMMIMREYKADKIRQS